MQKLMSLVRRCIDDYGMIEPADGIAVGVSGGKDSLSLLCALAGLREFMPQQFRLEAISLDLGFDGVDFSGVAELCRRLRVPFTLIKTDIKQIVFDIRQEKNPCSLCAKMRRGALHQAALDRGINKVALGHHFDDAAETFIMSLFYEGRIYCFQPVTYLDRRDITLIRPMLYAGESLITDLSKRLGLPVVHNPCPANGFSKRQEIKELLKTLEADYDSLREKIFGAMRRYPLKGWEPDAPLRRPPAE